MNQCKHFAECGGCSFQDIPYPEQLKQKEAKVKAIMSAQGLVCEIKPINSYEERFYRNKMEFTFSQNQQITCGLYSKKNRGEVIDLGECLIFSQDTGKILNAVREFAVKKNYSSYNKWVYRGFLRHLIVRETKFTGEIMIGMIATSGSEFDRGEFVNTINSLSLQSKVKSIYLVTNDSKSDAVVFEKKELLHGDPYLVEELDGFKFYIGVDSFFQVNPKGIKDLYKKIQNYSGLNDKERVLDIFCGVGCIGIFLSKAAKFVWGVELKQEIVEAAWQNAKLNHITNISFFAADAKGFLNSQGAFYRDSEVLVINPPRAGLSNKVKRAICRLNPKLIFYSSCNSETLFRDIKDFSAQYYLDFAELFDFFPHTPHVECLSVLRKKT